MKTQNTKRKEGNY